MTAQTCQLLRASLCRHGFTPEGDSPNGTFKLDDSYLSQNGIANLLVILVARREKVFASTLTVGREVSAAAYSDVVAAINAVVSVISLIAGE